MGRRIKGMGGKKINGENFKHWTREGSKSATIAEKKSLKYQNKKNKVRIIKSSGRAGKAGFYDIYVKLTGIQKKRF